MRQLQPNRRRIRTRWACEAIVAVGFLLAVPDFLAAQPTLNFKRVINNWPTIELYFSVGCNGAPSYDMKPENFEVYEDGVKIEDFTLWCPDMRARCGISAALVFDCSLAMEGAPLNAEKLAGQYFVSRMDGTIDEACVIRFGSSASLIQTMTTSTTLLNDAIAGLTTVSGNACWDACYEGLLEVIRAHSNPCCAVVLLTSGADNASTHDPTQIITLATRNRIRVFTIGVGDAIDAGMLQFIATSTGGKYYGAPTVTNLNEIYDEISTIIRESFHECMVTYESHCKDGAQRTIDLRLKNYCGGNDQKSRSYTAPKDTTTFTDLHIGLGSGTVSVGDTIDIALFIDNPMAGEYLQPSTFIVRLDNPACGLQFRHLDTPPGSILAAIPISVMPAGTTITIQTTQPALMTSNGLLMHLSFLAGSIIDTCRANIAVDSWTFSKGCLRPVTTPGQIRVLPLKPDAVCDMIAPQAIAWNRAARDYWPNPLTVNMIVTNMGNEDAKNTRYKITVDNADFSLVGPVVDVQPASPADVARFGGTSSAMWDLRAKQRATADTVLVTITASFDNFHDISCTSAIFIPAAEPMLACALDAPAIVVNHPSQQYEPMPFDLTATVSNIGAVGSDTVWSTILLPPDLLLAGPDAPGRFTKSIAGIAFNGQAPVRWQLSHQPSCTPVNDTVRVWTWTANADSSMCTFVVAIPALDSLAPGVAVTGSTTICAGDSTVLTADPGYLSYRWNTGATTPSIVVRTTGVYVCEVRGAGGCRGSSQPVAIAVETVPKPVVTRSGATLSTADPAARYVWARNGVPIPNATQSSLPITLNGAYTVTVITAHGCSATSAPFDVTDLLSVEPLPGALRIAVYPEPNDGMATLAIDTDRPQRVHVAMHDILGREVLVIPSEVLTGSVTRRLDMRGLPPGVYLLRVATAERVEERVVTKR